MTQLSNAFRRTANQLIKTFGKEGYIIRRNIETFDPENPTEADITEVQEWEVSAAVTDFDLTQIDNMNVFRGDKQVIVAHSETLPSLIQPGDYFVDGDIVYSIIPPDQVLEVNGIIICHILQCRR